MKYILFRSHHQQTEGTFRGTIVAILFIKDLQCGAGTQNEADLKFTIRTLKDGYESDSTLSYRKHCYTPTNSGPSPQAKALYTQVPLQRQKAIQARVSHFLKVQKGGDVPLQGLRMQVPEKKGKPGKNCMTTQFLCCCAQIVMRKYVSRFDHWHAGG